MTVATTYVGRPIKLCALCGEEKAHRARGLTWR
jgi:hypothetical protein